MFALLYDWPKDELMMLLKEIEQFALNADKDIDAYWQETAIRPEFFLSWTKAAKIDKVRDDAKMFVLETCAEISSVAQHFLSRNYGVEIPLKGNGEGSLE